MIKIIKHGRKTFKATCTTCGCEFIYELSDMLPLGGMDCPDCGHYVSHEVVSNNDEVTKHVEELIGGAK